MKVLMVLTSHDQLGNTGRKTGFWLEELAAPYYVFKDIGAQITLASPKGGRPPLDPKSNEPNSQTDITRRFEKDTDAEAQLDRTVRLESVKQEDYDTVFYPGGHGPMWDIVDDKNSIRLIESFLAAGKTFALVCHSSGALRHIKTPDGNAFVRTQDRDRLHQWRGRRCGIDESGALPCRGRTDAPRCHLFQGQELGRSHSRRRPADHRPESGLVGPGCQASDRYAEEAREIVGPNEGGEARSYSTSAASFAR